MRMYCLSNNLAKSCYVISFKGIRVMFDCGLSEETVLNFLPLSMVHSAKLANLPNWIPPCEHDPQLENELKECCGRAFVDSAPEFALPMDNMVDFTLIDVILISNYLNMLALPYITENSGFRGRVYATEPTLHIGRLFMEELVEFIESSSKCNSASLWKDYLSSLPSPLSEAFRPKKWRNIYTKDEIQKCLSKITTVGYDERLDILGAFVAIAVSSGFCLGSSNWVLNSGYQKVCYVSGSSTLTTHPRPINQVALRYADVLILTGITLEPGINPDTKLGELCMNVALTIRNNGSALIPCYSSGLVYDLFECLTQNMDNAGFVSVPMFFISPVADTSLAYSNILAEWLSSSKQNKVYVPDDPFPHAFYVRNSRLKFYKNIYSKSFTRDFRQPCVVFCGHPSLRFGEAVHFIQLWGNNPNNSIIFTEPNFPYLQALRPFQPLAMKSYYCPIDTSLNFSQANKLIKEMKPSLLVLPESYTKAHNPSTNHFIEHQDKKILTFKCGDILRMPLKRKVDRVYLTSSLATQMKFRDVGNGYACSSIAGVLKVKDNVHLMRPCRRSLNYMINYGIGRRPAPTKEETIEHVTYEYGKFNVDKMIKMLKHERISEKIYVQRSGSTITVNMIEEDIKIVCDKTSTHLFFTGKQATRLQLRDILLQCLHEF